MGKIGGFGRGNGAVFVVPVPVFQAADVLGGGLGVGFEGCLLEDEFICVLGQLLVESVGGGRVLN